MDLAPYASQLFHLHSSGGCYGFREIWSIMNFWDTRAPVSSQFSKREQDIFKNYKMDYKMWSSEGIQKSKYKILKFKVSYLRICHVRSVFLFLPFFLLSFLSPSFSSFLSVFCKDFYIGRLGKCIFGFQSLFWKKTSEDHNIYHIISYPKMYEERVREFLGR